MNAEQKKAYDCVRVRNKEEEPWSVRVLWSLYVDGVLDINEYADLSIAFGVDRTKENQ